MEPVDVLRDNRDDFACALERDDRMMDGVRLRTLINFPGFQLEIPILDPCGLRRQKLGVVDGTAPRPDSTRATEIRNAARRRDTGARENEDGSGGAEVFHQFIECWRGLTVHALLRSYAMMPQQ